MLTSTFTLQDNMFTGSLPCELGYLTSIQKNLNLEDNHFCARAPDGLRALANQTAGFSIDEGNSIGTPC